MNHDQNVTNILYVAARCTDPDKLREYAEMLTKRSAYKEAAHVERKAKEIERQYAEQAANK